MDSSIFIYSIFFSFIIHFGVQKVFIYFKKFDDFNHRSSHNTLATRTGGIGVYLNLLFVSLFFYFQRIEIFDYSLFIPLSIMFVIGIYDDFYNADFKLKFLLQIIVAKILIDQGYVINNYHGLFGLNKIPWVLAQLSTIFVFLVVVNAINFIDGIDGLAISQVIKGIVLFEIFSSQTTEISSIGKLIIFSLIPLYYFNFKKKRKIFLGDAGSMLLGTIIMVYILYLLGDNYEVNKNLYLNKTLLSVLIVFHPLVDLLRVFFLRVIKGLSPYVADQNHIHHKLLNFYKEKHYKVVLAIMVTEIILILLITKSFIN